ncbi:MAG TPA: IS110 family transposase [Nitrospira sp.]|uniref:IS110 family transposase n=1 Tax=Haliangium sp. UPWRP_2 TaxID=1931276 RepID=UPI0018EC5DD0|nr:IS110 family transposase [Haliangium sp. UPWRP_2]HNM20599.1 IS110 family transposase [Nitrospira sp.]HNP42407.1 IS110 family transposase [Nitrospira sp.]
MTKPTRYLGLDVHKDLIAVAVCDEAGPARSLGAIPNSPEAVERLMRKLTRDATILAAYEAGPCGYVLYRQLSALSVPCIVVAPTLIPVKSGDRVKTDRRDAEKLAHFLRSGDLTPVWVPDESHQGLRDLLRGRQDAKQDQRRARNRLSKFLLREGLCPSDGSEAFSAGYFRWLKSLQLPIAAQARTLDDCIAEVMHQDARVKGLESDLAELVKTLPHAMQKVMAALQCLHGIALLSAATIVAEAGELSRFRKAGQLFSYAGLVPSERSSGGPRGQSRGGITKTGNSHLRGIVVEASWHFQSRPGVSAALLKRRQGQDPRILAIADQAHQRLHRKFRRMEQRGKSSCKAAVAVARELLGFVWAIARQVDAMPDSLAPQQSHTSLAEKHTSHVLPTSRKAATSRRRASTEVAA